MQYVMDLGLDEMYPSPEQPELDSYDHIIVMMSGGKDSIACVLHLLELGYRPELWHHAVDGNPNETPRLAFDWPVTHSYVQAFAKALDLELYFSWREGGISGEMFKQEDRLKGVWFETPDGVEKTGGERGKIATRMRWPAVSPNLAVRWCSAVAKIDVGSAAIAGQNRFRGKRTLVVTGERAEESKNRASYSSFEPHRTHAPGKVARRHVDHWRPVHGWSEDEVWAIMRRWKIAPHPSYLLSFSRCSCQICIFLCPASLATLKLIDPDKFAQLKETEVLLGHTIRNGVTVAEAAAKAAPFPYDVDAARQALSRHYEGPIITENWRLPPGAFKHSGGPT